MEDKLATLDVPGGARAVVRGTKSIRARIRAIARHLGRYVLTPSYAGAFEAVSPRRQALVEIKDATHYYIGQAAVAVHDWLRSHNLTDD